MSLPIRLLQEAERELQDAVDWYEGRQAGLGASFLANVRETFNRIAANPRMYRQVYGDVRQAVIRRFPYVVLYQEEQSDILIVSVFHTSRDPGDWRSRV